MRALGDTVGFKAALEASALAQQSQKSHAGLRGRCRMRKGSEYEAHAADCLRLASTAKELVQAKIEQRAPEIAVEAKGKAPKVINIMTALKQSVQAKGRAKVKEAVRERSGKQPKDEARPTPAARARPGGRRARH